MGWRSAAPSRPLSKLNRKRDAIRYFAPSWFTIVSSTGLVAELIGTFPYTLPAMREVGWAFWWLAVTLFCIFSTMLAARFQFFWRDALDMFSAPQQAVFLGSVPPALSVIIATMPVFCGHYWDAGRVMEAAVVLWWINVGLAMAVTALLPFFFFSNPTFGSSLEGLTAIWLVPIFPCVVASGVGGIIATQVSQGAAKGIIYMGYLLWGVGVPLCFAILTIYYQRLLSHSLPPRELIVSSFLPLVPMGVGATAAITLGAAMVRSFPPPSTKELMGAWRTGDMSAQSEQWRELLNEVYVSSVAGGATASGNIVAVVLWGAGLWWLLVAIASAIRTAHDLPFNIGWWGGVFPLGAYAGAANLLWRHLPALEPMRIVAALLIACEIAFWCLCMLLTIRQGWSGSLFHAPCMHAVTFKRSKDGQANAGGGCGGRGSSSQEQDAAEADAAEAKEQAAADLFDL